MCGIVGIIGKSQNSGFNHPVRAMADLLKHRGPDADGFYVNNKEGVYFGHRRLSIIDLSQSANQPFFNEDKSICLVCNGEIYNFKELRDILQQKGHIFISNSDSEIILHSYEEWDLNCLEKLRGMFAFAIWDAKKKCLILARDRLGIKPLYYIAKEGFFTFASEVKAFFTLREFWQPQIDQESLQVILEFPFIPNNESTLLKEVRKVPSAHFLIFKQEECTFTLRRYWKLEKNDQFTKLSFLDATQKLEELLLESLKLHLQAEVPIGILLSGGLDSSLIAAMAKKVYPSDVYTYTAGYDHPWDERGFALQVSKHVKTIHFSIQINPLEVNDTIEKLIWHFDDLSTLDPGILSTYLISQKVKELGVKVVLVGEGGDELLGGYSWFGLSQLPFKLLPQYLRSSLYYYATSRILLNRNLLRNISFLNKKIQEFDNEDIFRKISSFELLYQLPNSYLMKVDKATMANSLEARVPYLDHKVVEFVYSLPRQYKLHGNWFNMKKPNEKYILREIAKKYLPKEIAMRKKRGFSIPLPQVLKSNMDKIRDCLLSNNSLALSIFPRKKLESLFDFKTRLYSPIEKEKESLLWKLYLLETWSNLYLKSRY